ncbi:(2Fe-2S)-binding protein [Mycolicibacterium sp.]|uniref:(2Fe-2S)-binding protein n=1 Tax=Mycolicibacterium sp. TaxID=2320850 RepID=UPI0037CB2FF2
MSDESTGRWLEAGDTATINLAVNGGAVTVGVAPRHTLADALRAAGLTGTHLGCEHGVCGACTVLVDGEAVRSCLMLALQAEGRVIETVEGLADDGDLNALQRAFHENHALQCGFCTAGFLMLAEEHVRTEPTASPERTREVMSSNLCRCTGYAGILAAVEKAKANSGERL